MWIMAWMRSDKRVRWDGPGRAGLAGLRTASSVPSSFRCDGFGNRRRQPIRAWARYEYAVRLITSPYKSHALALGST